jgi:hypothetical protein
VKNTSVRLRKPDTIWRSDLQEAAAYHGYRGMLEKLVGGSSFVIKKVCLVKSRLRSVHKSSQTVGADF